MVEIHQVMERWIGHCYCTQKGGREWIHNVNDTHWNKLYSAICYTFITHEKQDNTISCILLLQPTLYISETWTNQY